MSFEALEQLGVGVSEIGKKELTVSCQCCRWWQICLQMFLFSAMRLQHYQFSSFFPQVLKDRLSVLVSVSSRMSQVRPTTILFLVVLHAIKRGLCNW